MNVGIRCGFSVRQLLSVICDVIEVETVLKTYSKAQGSGVGSGGGGGEI